MKDIIKNPLMWVTYLAISAMLALIPLSMWVWSDAGGISVRTVLTATITGLWLGFAFYLWALLLADGKWLYISWRIQAARDSMWSIKNTNTVYLKKNWLRFVLHACIVAGATTLVYILGDFIVFHKTVLLSHVYKIWFYAVLFIANVLIVMVGRYIYRMADENRTPVSKHY